MQTFSINDHTDIDDNIKSLSDSDEDDFKEEEEEEEIGFYKIANKIENKTEERVQNEEVEVNYLKNEKEEVLEEEIVYQDENLLDKDMPIFEVLRSHGYKSLHKLCYTDQGSVWRGKLCKKLGSKSVVIKIASKLHYEKRSEHEDIIKEIELLKRINKQGLYEKNENLNIANSIINVIDTIENDENYFVVLEDGGQDCFSFIESVHKQINAGKIAVGEWRKTVKLIAKRLIKLIHWLHNSNFLCHLDISLENILISNIKWISYPDQYKNYKKRLSPDFSLKLIDFGAAICFKRQYDLNGNITFNSSSIIGKPLYCSPQIYQLQIGTCDKTFDARQADLWSFGICIFILAIGCPPWTLPHQTNKLFETIVLEKNLNFVLNAWNRSNYCDDSMKDLLQKIFVFNEQNRITTNDIIKHSSLL
eukprot:957991_1